MTNEKGYSERDEWKENEIEGKKRKHLFVNLLGLKLMKKTMINYAKLC